MKPHFWLVKFEAQAYVELYGIPKIGVPPHHEIFIEFSIINHPAVGASSFIVGKTMGGL